MKLRLYSIGVVLAALAAFAPPAQAIEPAQEFLDGLRERGYYDVALEYLDAAAQNPAVPVQFKQTILYEKGVTLVQGAKHQRDSALREKQLDEGQQVLQQFIGANPNSILSVGARSQLGNVIVERARNRMEKSKRLSISEKQSAIKEARGLYEEATTVFAGLVEELRERLKAYPAALDEKKDAKRVEERDRFRTDFLQSQLLVAATREELSETMEKGSKERTDTLTKAADEYKEVYEKYRTRLAGLYARMYQGRCLQKLGKHKEASAIFNEQLANPDEPEAFRTLKTKVMALAVDSWYEQKLYKELIEKASKTIDSARPAEDKTDELMLMRYTVARATKAYADELRKANPKDPLIKKYLTDGRTMLTYVTKFPSEYQDAARKLLPDFTGGDVASSDRPEPKNFLEARTAAKEAIDAMQAANLLLKALPTRLQSAAPAEKPEIEKQLAEAEAQAQKGKDDALAYCRLALKFVDRETEVTDVNLIRYLLCYLLYADGNYYDATVIGEFIARRYPDSQGARQCAKIAMAGYLKLYAENQTDDKSYESAQIISICDYIVKKWPDQTEAAEALNTLIPFMIREKKLQEAQDYLAKIPPESPHRGSAELKTGQAMWASYLENSKQIRDWENNVVPTPEGTDLAARKKELEDLKTKAKQTLIDGVDRMQKGGEASQVMATAVLSLAQIYVDTNEAQKAVALLEDPKIGLLTLVKNNDPTTQREGFPEETFKTALRAYISSLAAGADAAATVEKAKGVMASLKEYMGPDGQPKLVAIYVSLARDLQRQMEIAEPEVKKGLGLGFENFLSQVAADATELNVLNWVAETYYGMGESFTDGKQLSADASKYFAKAAETYRKILEKGKTDTKFLSGPMTTQIRMQLAKTERSTGRYKEAMDIFEMILKESPTILPVQIEAARTYQDWGGFKGLEENYMRAIMGGRPDKDNLNPAKTGRNIIWGWGEIAAKTAGNATFKDQFHEARYNLALCRYNYALAQKDATKKQSTLNMAKRDIAIIAGFYPDLGGDKWRAQYDSLLKTVQRALGERPLGLQGLKNTAPASTAGGGAKVTPTSNRK